MMANTVWKTLTLTLLFRIAMLHIVISTVTAFKSKTTFGKVQMKGGFALGASVSSYTIKEHTEVTEIVKKSRFIGKVSTWLDRSGLQEGLIISVRTRFKFGRGLD
jgi:putative IMPACT (imprinted ancient) family translation regulator